MEISLLERYLPKAGSPPPLVFVSGPEGSGKAAHVQNIISPMNDIIINCQFYDGFSSIIRQVSAAIGSPDEPFNTLRELVEQVISSPPEDPFYIVLNGVEHLMEIDVKGFQLFCQLRQLARCPRIGMILVSQCCWQHFYPLHSLRPLIFTTTILDNPANLVSSLLTDLVVEGQTKTTVLKPFLEFILKLLRNQFNQVPLIVDLVKRLYPVFEGGVESDKITAKELNRLYKKSESQAQALIRAENIQKTTCALVESFSVPERYLLIAIYLASHNHPKHDLELFGSNGSKSKRPRKVMKAKGKPKKVPEQPKCNLKAVPIERLLAIFYFIYPVDLKAPDRACVLMVLNRLIGCKLIVRGSLSAKSSQSSKVKCNFGQSLIGHISRKVGFKYEQYLANPN